MTSRSAATSDSSSSIELSSRTVLPASPSSIRLPRSSYLGLEEGGLEEEEEEEEEEEKNVGDDEEGGGGGGGGGGFREAAKSCRPFSKS